MTATLPARRPASPPPRRAPGAPRRRAGGPAARAAHPRHAAGAAGRPGPALAGLGRVRRLGGQRALLGRRVARRPWTSRSALTPGRCTSRSRTPTRPSPRRSSPAPSRRSRRCSATRPTSPRPHADLSALHAAGGSQADASAALAALGGGLPAYTGYVARGHGRVRDGLPADRRLVPPGRLRARRTWCCCPPRTTVFTQENDALSAASGQATGLPHVLAALVLALVTAFVLYRAQRWLTRRTNRVLSPGLVLASLLLVISVIWLAAGFLAARSDLDGGIGHGSAPAQHLALGEHRRPADQGRRGAQRHLPQRQRLLPGRLPTTSKTVGPGNGQPARRRGRRAAGRRAGRRARGGRRAGRDRLVRGQRPGVPARQQGQLRRRAEAVIGPGTGSSATGYTALERDITRAISADQGVFGSAATAGASALDPLEPVVIVDALLMAVGCAWAAAAGSRNTAKHGPGCCTPLGGPLTGLAPGSRVAGYVLEGWSASAGWRRCSGPATSGSAGSWR